MTLQAIINVQVRELKDSNLIVKQKALIAARELLGSSTSYVQCIAHGITPAVIALLQDADALVRERAAGTMEYLSVKELGARDVVQHGGIQQLVVQLQDQGTTVRDAAYSALIEAARFDVVRIALVKLRKALPLLMKLVLEEELSRALRGLTLLNACVQVRNNELALKQLVDDAACVPSLSQLISNGKNEAIQEQAAQLLGLVASTFTDAKLEAVQTGCVPKLIALLDQQTNVLLATAATTALMMITIVNDGKYAVVNCDQGLERLAGPWMDPMTSEHVCVNITQCITNVAEAPEARPVLVQCGAMGRLVAIFEDEGVSEIVKRGAAEAMRQCRFTYLPHKRLPGREKQNEEHSQGAVEVA
jgi:hypothetical protein